MSGARRKEGSYFNENSPRPPVPGEDASTSHFRPESPASLTPRRSSVINKYNDKKINNNNNNNKLSPPMGFEPEGCCEKITMEKNSPKYTCLQWARDLRILLKDEIGLDLFRKYLQKEKISDIPLIFWFSCEGLKDNNDDDKIQQLIKIIYKRFIKNQQLPISQELRRDTHNKIRANKFDKKIYDQIQKEVERSIRETTYPNFIRSEMYLNYIHEIRNNNFFNDKKNLSTNYDMSLSCSSNNLLPTLHEDSEFTVNHMTQSACNTPGEFKLTQDILMKTQQTRAATSLTKPEVFAGVSPYHMTSSRPDAQYSYNPVSRQDSELQSLSSDARTESDNLSLNSSVDGATLNRRNNRIQTIRSNRQMKESIKLNHNAELDIAIVPRTAYSLKNNKTLQPCDMEELFSKLNKFIKEREKTNKLDCSLENSTNNNGPSNDTGDNNEHILDNHLTRIWGTEGIKTPSRDVSQSSDIKHSLKSKKDKDIFSTLSIDSGNIPDLGDNAIGGSIPKSKSVPSEYAESFDKIKSYESGNHNISKQSITKKSTTELTDSGVSVISDTRPAIPAKGYRASTWSNTHDIKTPRHQKHEWQTTRPAQPIATDPDMPLLPAPNTFTQLDEARRRLESNQRYGNDDQNNIGNINPSNIHYSLPNKQQQFDTASVHSVSHLSSVSNQSTIRRNRQHNDNCTRVCITVCDDDVPYLIKIPGFNITLRQFKDNLPQKGNHRYFFKTTSEDSDVEVFWEEITDDTEILPLWNGKIRAQVKPVD